MRIEHRIYYFVERVQTDEPTVHSIEAYSDGEARIILGERLHVTATSLIDVTNYEGDAINA